MPGQAWQWDSLSGKVGAPAAGSAPMGYVTGEGTPDWAARVVYQALDGYIVEMYLTPGQP